jgi:hypothetical protein
MNSYCWWDFDYNQHGLTKEQVKSLNSLLVESAWNIYNTSQEESYMTKDNVYLKLLEGFNYEHHQTISEKSGKAQSSYQWMFEGCKKTFNRAWNLLNHANMHKGVKPYKCQMWDKSFTQKGNLKKHITTHLLPDLKNRKRYLCHVCGKSYTEKYNYKVCIQNLKVQHFSSMFRIPCLPYLGKNFTSSLNRCILH